MGGTLLEYCDDDDDDDGTRDNDDWDTNGKDTSVDGRQGRT